MNMAKVTVKIDKDFTIVPNEIIRNKEMTSSAKNILLTMLSLPTDWDFTVNGIASCVREGKDSVRKALLEIEKFGYITRTRIRDKDGTLSGMEYTVYQFPVPDKENTYRNNFLKKEIEKPTLEKPTLEKPTLEKPTLEKPTLENKTQLNKDIELSKDIELNKDYYPPIPPRGKAEGKQKRKISVPPTPEEVQAYCDERKNGITGDEFVDFYAARGWMIGKYKMKDWKAAVRTWEKNRERRNYNPTRYEIPEPIPGRTKTPEEEPYQDANRKMFEELAEHFKDKPFTGFEKRKMQNDDGDHETDDCYGQLPPSFSVEWD